MSPPIDAPIDAPIESSSTLEAQCEAAEREASAALLALSARMFIRPTLHDGLRGSELFRHWRACSDRARQLRERLDALAAARA